MFDCPRLSLDGLKVSTSFPPPSTSSLANFASKTPDIESDPVPKHNVNPSGVRLVHYRDSHVKRPGKTLAPAYPSSLSAPMGQSTSSGHSVNNLGSLPIDPSSLNMLHFHPFSQVSTQSIDSGCSSSHWVKGSDPASHTASDPSRPPSSASFMDMGKSIDGKRDYSSQVQKSGRRWARSVSDGIPLIKYHTRKGSSRFWRTLVRPSALSFLDNPKHPDTHSIPAVSVELGDIDASLLSSSQELPPRPAPYFYPRRVDCERDGLSHGSFAHDSFFCNLGELPIDSSSNASKHKSKFIPMSQNTGKLQGLRGGDGEDDTSIDSDEIETWKKRQTNLARQARRSGAPSVPSSFVLIHRGQKSRPSLRQRFGSSLRQSIGFQHLRSARSELEVRQSVHQQDQSETMGPGITDDPFASHLTSPQMLPAQMASLPVASQLTHSPTPLSPLLSSSEPALDFSLLNLETRRRSFMNMDPDCDNASTSSSISRSDISHRRHISYSNLSCSSVLACSTQPKEKVTSTFVPQSRVGRVSEDSGILCQTPILTPDLDSIEASSPSLSDSLCDIQVTCVKNDQDSTKPIIPFPSFVPSQEPLVVSDVFEESAVEEGTSQDQIYCASDLPHVDSIPSDSGDNNKGPRPRHKISLRDCTADVSVVSIDMPENITDFTLLAVDWPLPPSHTSPEPGIAHGDKLDLEDFIPVQALAGNRPLGSHRRLGDHRTPPTDDNPSLEKLSIDPFSKPLTLEISQRPSTVTSSSPIDFVQVTLGSSILNHTDFPKVIILASTTETQPTGTSISFRAASRLVLVLVSFFAFHAETRLETQSLSSGCTSILANVTLSNVADDDQVNSDTATVTLTDKNSRLKPAKDGSIGFSLNLPISLGELAVTIAKVSFGKCKK